MSEVWNVHPYYLPEEKIQQNWTTLCSMTEHLLKNQFCAGKQGNPFLDMVDALKENYPGHHRGETVLGLRRAPGGSRNHHAYLGGLVQHLMEMWSLSEVLLQRMRMPDWLETDYMTPERIWAGILLHDIHKVGDYVFHSVRDETPPEHLQPYYQNMALAGQEPGYVDYNRDRSRKRLTKDQRSMMLANRFGIVLDELQLNAFYQSEGGYAENPPEHGSVLGKFLYLLDELSGNVMSRLEHGSFYWDERGRPILGELDLAFPY